jgi:hypothetical protein
VTVQPFKTNEWDQSTGELLSLPESVVKFTAEVPPSVKTAKYEHGNSKDEPDYAYAALLELSGVASPPLTSSI